MRSFLSQQPSSWRVRLAFLLDRLADIIDPPRTTNGTVRIYGGIGTIRRRGSRASSSKAASPRSGT